MVTRSKRRAHLQQTMTSFLGVSAAVVFFLCVPAVSALTGANVVATKTAVTTFCQTSSVKLVFVNKGLLYYVDFSESETPVIHKFNKVTFASTPSISPDGQYVAYSTSPKPSTNATDSGAIYLITFSETAAPVLAAASGYNPRFIKNATIPTLVYTTNSESDSWNGKGKVTSKRIVSGVPVATDSTIWAGGSYNGGLSWDNRYLGHSNQAKGAYMLDLQNSTAGAQTLHCLHFTNTITATDTFFASQTCNGSISSSHVFTNAMMYLDFGSPNNYRHPILGTWQIHDRVFISDYNGNILKYIMVPAEIPVYLAATALNGQVTKKQIGEPEWATHPYYAAVSIYLDRLFLSSGYPHTYNLERIYCFNLKDSTYLPLVVSSDTLTMNGSINMLYPFLYIATPTGFSENQTWLATPAVPSAVKHAAFSHASGALGVRLIKNQVFSSHPIASVARYGLNGRCLERIVLNTPATKFTFSQVALTSAVTVIEVALVNGERALFFGIEK